MEMNINFPNLHIYLEYVGKYIDLFGFRIAYYGITLALGIVAGIVVAQFEAKRTNQNQEDYLDLALVEVVFSVIGARLYYVIFSWDSYKEDLLSIFNLRQGGLAIYGGIISAVITVYLFSRKRNLSFPQLLDTGCLGLITGQIIGRWGNFFNREAFGGYTDHLFAMEIPVSAVRSSDITKELLRHMIERDGISYIQVHPTFLYESLWNIVVLSVLLILRKKIKFEGEVFLMYLLGYGLGRVWIEGLRTDQLLTPIGGIPVSQALAAFLAVISAVMIIVFRRRHNRNTW